MPESNRDRILPFNLTLEEYLQMANQELPEKLSMLVMLIPSTETLSNLNIDVLQKVYMHPWQLAGYDGEKVPQSIKPVFESCKYLEYEFAVQEINTMTKSSEFLPPELRAWMFEDLYCQVVFGRDASICRPPFAIGATMAMTHFDVNCASSRSINVDEHPVHVLEPDNPTSDWVNDIYRSGRGIWSPKLIEFRNYVLIGIRAILMDRDPDTEYQRFINAGGKYFLAYPGLCP